MSKDYVFCRKSKINELLVDLRVKKIGLKLYLCTSPVKVSLPGRPLQMCGMVQNSCEAFF